MQKATTCLFFIFISTFIFGQSPVGTWVNIDDEDGIAKSHIRIYNLEGKLYGKVVKLLPAADITHCHKCKGDKKHQPILDMVILKDMEKKGTKWDGGLILDPGKGKEYKCQISLEDHETLNVRGYIGSPIFGRTQQWFRLDQSEVD